MSPLDDELLVDYVLEESGIDPEVVPWMYGQGILRPGKPVICSRWGLDFALVTMDPPLPEIGIEQIVSTHEIGHAIVMLERGLKFQYVDMAIGEMKPLGSKQAPREGTDEFDDYMIGKYISIAGGPIATSMLLHQNSSTIDIGGEDDFVYLCNLERINNYKLLADIVYEATRIVVNRWGRIQGLAEELRRFKRLKHHQCMRIIQSE